MMTITDRPDPDPPAPAQCSRLQGRPVSAGSATGRALVAEFPDAAAAGSAADILIVPSLVVALIPAFRRVAGVISERGGTLSSVATVLREAGIPVVVLAGATTHLRTGERLTFDGSTGTVRRLG